MYTMGHMTKKTSYKKPADSGLSIIIPIYNAEMWIGATLKYLDDSLRKTKWKSLEIITVDDGSTDGTIAVLKKIKLDTKIRIISQKNAGRFLARKKGLEAAKGEYVFFIDSRVFTKPDSFAHLVQQLNSKPRAVIWNGHVDVERQGNPYARFWHAVTFIAWRKYMADPRIIHYGLEDFDYYPKGTTCFFAPRNIIKRAYAQFKTSYKNLGDANDDSSLIRYMAKEADIYISPGFAFTYNSRSTLKAFIKHTLHRGVVFIDGYFKRGTRYFYPLLCYMILLPAVILMASVYPISLLLLVPGLLMVWLTALLLKVHIKDATAFAIVLPLFALFYTAGLYKGAYMKLSSRL